MINDVNGFRKLIPRFDFFLLYAVMSALAAPLAYIPAVLTGLIGSVLFGFMFYPETLFPLLGFASFTLVYLIPLAAFAILYKFVIYLKNENLFFLVTVLILIAGHAFFLHTETPFMLEGGIGLFSLLAIYIIFVALSLTFARKFLTKNFTKGNNFLLIPMLVDVGIIIFDTSIPPSTFLLNIYIAIGEWIKEVSNINIFYLDFSGFAFIFINLINSIILFMLVALRKRLLLTNE